MLQSLAQSTRKVIAFKFLFFIALLFGISACSPGQTVGVTAVPSGSNGAAQSSDLAVAGKLLAVRDGALVLWSSGTLRAITVGQRYRSPSFSPDGARIAAEMVGDNHSDIMLLDPNGGRLARLTNNWSKSSLEDSAWARHPTWSPDGNHIAYAGDQGGPEMSLWSIDTTGVNRRQILPSPGWDGLDQPSWSPNGSNIAVTVFEDNASQIYLVDAFTGKRTKLTDQEGGAYDPAFSPDGARVPFVGRTNGRNDIWLADLAGSSPVRLTDLGVARTPAWSPDGALLAFLADKGNGSDIYALSPNLRDPRIVPANNHKRLTDGRKLDAPSGLSWSR